MITILARQVGLFQTAVDVWLRRRKEIVKDVKCANFPLFACLRR